MNLSKFLLPLLAISFCCGLTACTDDAESSDEIVLGSGSETKLSRTNCEKLFNIEVEEKLFPDDDPTTYEYKVAVTPKLSKLVVTSKVEISVEVQCTYKLEANTNTAYFKKQEHVISIVKGTNKGVSQNSVITFDQPIEEYPYFTVKHTVIAASGKVTYRD